MLLELRVGWRRAGHLQLVVHAGVDGAILKVAPLHVAARHRVDDAPKLFPLVQLPAVMEPGIELEALLLERVQAAPHAVVLLEHQHPLPLPPEKDRRRETARARPDNDDVGMLRALLLLQAAPQHVSGRRRRWERRAAPEPRKEAEEDQAKRDEEEERGGGVGEGGGDGGHETLVKARRRWWAGRVRG